jgi:3D (Asp-Asp-Asp) domain-containing protein
MKKIIKLSLFISLFALVLFASCSKNDAVDVATAITLNKSTSYLIIGQTDSLLATLTASGNIQNISQTWSTSNSAVASVVNGVVTALTAGTSTITVTSGTKSASCLVTVDDKILPSITQGQLWYYGNAYGTDTINHAGSNNFILYMASSGINLNTLTGVGELLVIELNTPLTVTDSIPTGTYDMMTDLTKLINFKPFTLVPGYNDPNTNYPWGCWYFGNITDPVSSGNIVVSKVNAIYTINYEFYDDYGVKISGNYMGTLSYVDGTLPSSVKAAKARLHLKSVSHLNKTMKFKRI